MCLITLFSLFQLVTVVKVGSPPAWGEESRTLKSFQTFPRAHSRTTSSSDSPETGPSATAVGLTSLNPLSGPESVHASGSGGHCSGTLLSSDGSSILTVLIPLGAGDRRFGFSVIGGVDERFAPKIEAINAGL